MIIVESVFVCLLDCSFKSFYCDFHYESYCKFYTVK